MAISRLKARIAYGRRVLSQLLATADHWKQAYYYDEGPALSGAWPVADVPRLFYDYVAARGCTLVGGVQFDAKDIAREDHWTWRGPYFSGFSMLARKQ